MSRDTPATIVVYKRRISWVCGGKFYGLPFRGKTLELDRKDAVVIQGKEIVKNNPENTNYIPENCVLACALCNMAKSNMFTHEEFHEVGKVIEEIWRKRKSEGLTIRGGRDRCNSYNGLYGNPGKAGAGSSLKE